MLRRRRPPRPTGAFEPGAKKSLTELLFFPASTSDAVPASPRSILRTTSSTSFANSACPRVTISSSSTATSWTAATTPAKSSCPSFRAQAPLSRRRLCQPRQPRGAPHQHLRRLRGGVRRQVRSRRIPGVPRRLLVAPHACVVNGRALVLHAGLPADETVGVSHVRSLARGPDVCSEEANWGKEGWIRDMLWSDPHPDPEFRGMEQSARGAGVLWGEDATIAFLEPENLSAIVRSHQCVPNGVAIQHGGRVFTVFSASNYCGSSGNLGAVLIFRHGNDRPTETYQWDPYKDPKMSGTIITKRSGRSGSARPRFNRRRSTSSNTERHFWRTFDAATRERPGGCPSTDGPRRSRRCFRFDWPGTSSCPVSSARTTWTPRATACCTSDGSGASPSSSRVGAASGRMRWWRRSHPPCSNPAATSDARFGEIDADGSGEISAEEFRVAVRRRLPSLAVLSDTQLEAVVNAFDADGSGQVDAAEFESLLTSHIARTTGRAARDAGASNPSDTSRDARAVVGLQWRTRVDDDEASDRGDGAHAGGGDSAGPDRLERALASAVSRLFTRTAANSSTYGTRTSTRKGPGPSPRTSSWRRFEPWTRRTGRACSARRRRRGWRRRSTTTVTDASTSWSLRGT